MAVHDQIWLAYIVAGQHWHGPFIVGGRGGFSRLGREKSRMRPRAPLRVQSAPAESAPRMQREPELRADDFLAK